MAGYRDELERLGFSGEEKAELARRLAAGRPTAERRRMRLPYRGLVAVVAAVSLLVGAAGAASLAGVSPAFRELFGITSEEQVQNLGVVHLNQVFEDKNGSGASVTVKEVAADQEQIYILVEFAAPEGTVLPEPDQREEGLTRAILWGGPDGRGIGYGLYADENCTSVVNHNGMGYDVDYVEDSDPTDNKMEFIIRGHIDPMPKDAAYCLFSGIQSLCMQYQGEWVTMLDGMDIDLIVPLVGMGTHYDFQGRCGVNLNGVTLAVAENLTISPISVSMDLVIPDGAAYDAAFGQDGPWQMYVLMSDGSKIQTRFEKVGGVQDVFHDDAGRTFFRADHVRFELESPIDVAEIQNLVFTGDNSRIYEGEDRTGTLIQFDFGPWHFQNETYWNEVNYYWRKD